MHSYFVVTSFELLIKLQIGRFMIDAFTQSCTYIGICDSVISVAVSVSTCFDEFIVLLLFGYITQCRLHSLCQLFYVYNVDLYYSRPFVVPINVYLG
jgi:hypothetical protein